MTTTMPESRLMGGLQIREVDTTDDLSLIEGLAVPYMKWANVGFYYERFAPGAFAKSIKEAARRLPLNLFHNNQTFPIGSASEWRDDDAGLYGVWKLSDSPEAKRAAREARDGHLTGLSIEFQPIPNRDDWSFAEDRGLSYDPMGGFDYADQVTRNESRLGGTALVPTPAFVEAGVRMVRSAPPARRGGPAPRSATPSLDAARRILEEMR